MQPVLLPRQAQCLRNLHQFYTNKQTAAHLSLLILCVCVCDSAGKRLPISIAMCAFSPRSLVPVCVYSKPRPQTPPTSRFVPPPSHRKIIPDLKFCIRVNDNSHDFITSIFLSGSHSLSLSLSLCVCVYSCSCCVSICRDPAVSKYHLLYIVIDHRSYHHFVHVCVLIIPIPCVWCALLHQMVKICQPLILVTQIFYFVLEIENLKLLEPLLKGQPE